MRKKCIPMLLALAMVLSLFVGVVPATAAAAGGYDYPQEAVVTNENMSSQFSQFARYATASGIVVPGLTKSSNLVPQGLTYWAEKGWFLVSLENRDSSRGSIIAALDKETGKLVAQYELDQNVHMGGLAVSKYNLYVCLGSGKLGYIPLSSLGATSGTEKISVSGSLKVVVNGPGAAYCTYDPDSGVLLSGNFYLSGNSTYGKPELSDAASVVYGFQLGSCASSEEEWAALQAAKQRENGADFVVKFTDVDRVQYALYHDGRLLLSRSWGRKSSVTNNYISELDSFALNTLTDTTLTASNVQKMLTCPPMAEGIVLVGSDLYVLFESGAYKYRAETKNNKCAYPTDELWKVDTSAWFGSSSDPGTDKSVWYEKVTSLDDLTDAAGQYLIVYNKNNGSVPTQYAMQTKGLNADGQKGSTATGNQNPSQDDGDSMYMKPMVLQNYTVENQNGVDRYYFNVPESALWHFDLDPADTNHAATIISNDPSFSANPCLYFGSRLMYMQEYGQFERQAYVHLKEAGNGYFQLYYQNMGSGSPYYLWCNDGRYNDTYDYFYKNGNQKDQHQGVYEDDGTFHCDAFYDAPLQTGKDTYETALVTWGKYNSGNKTLAGSEYKWGLLTLNYNADMGGEVDSKYTNFTIYKQHQDVTETVTGKSGTNLTKAAALQADGTYTIDLSAYTTGQYTASDGLVERLSYADTDFVFVLDMSGSMEGNRLTNLTTAVKAFLTQLRTAQQEHPGTDYRVAMVTYAGSGDEGNGYKNTGYYKGASFVSYPDRDTSYRDILQDADSTDLDAIVGKLSPNNATATQLGMEMANGILSNSGAEYLDKTSENYRNAAVVVFTDGAPGQSAPDSYTVPYANAAIAQAKKCKGLGAEVYAVGLNLDFAQKFTSPYYFTTNKFMNVLSSNYPDAMDLTQTGKRASDKYFFKAETQEDLTGIFRKICTTTIKGTNSTGTDVTFNAQSVMKDIPSDSFTIPQDAQVVVSFQPGTTADGSNYAFGNEMTQAEFEAATGSTITAGIAADGAVTVTGFDYSQYYIAYGHPGYKMLVRINGVLLKDGTSGMTLATNADTSGIYNGDEVVNKFEVPTVNVPEQSYTLDFGLPATASLGDRTVLALSAAPAQQDEENYVTAIDGAVGVNVTTTVDSAAITMSPCTNWGDVQQDYALTVKDDGTYEWVKLTIVPASNILYEEDKLTVGNEDGKTAWTTAGTDAGYQQTIDNALRYGYDGVYKDNINTYGNGTAYAATVNKNNKFSKNLSFTFTGTGFDIISDCSNKTGILAVKLQDSSGKLLKAYIVDTYFKGDEANTIAHGTTLYQTPVVQNLTLDYGTYTVTMNAMYLHRSDIEKAEASPETLGTGNSALVKELLAQAGMTDVDPAQVELVYMDDDSILSPNHQPSPVVFDGEEQAMDWTTYVDGVRVYGALAGKDQSVYLASEQNVTYYNIINSMIANTEITNSTVIGMAYIEGVGDTAFDPATYQNSGPQNEIYLTTGNAIVFKVAGGSVVQVSARAVTDTAAQINGDKDVTSNTEMYYEVRANNDGTVVIQNTGAGMLALVNVKITAGTTPTVDLDTLTEACQLLAAGTPEPPAPTEPTEPTEPTVPTQPVDPSEPTQAWVNPFTDVHENDWFYDAVRFVNERKLFVGTSETTFAPRMAMTRGMFVTVLGTLAGVDEASAAASTFTDVSPNAYYAPYVAWAQQHGIVVGTSATTFEPNAEITREQMAIIMYNYAKYAGKDVSNTDPAGLAAFADGASVSAWAQTEMAWAVNLQLMVGSDGKLSPQNHASRAEVAEIVKNYVSLLGK